MFMGYGVGQIIAPHFFISSEAPRYPTGFRAFYVSVSLMIVIESLMMYVSPLLTNGTKSGSNCRSVYLKYQNRKKAQAAASETHAQQDALAYDFLDLTDKEHAGFRYVL